MFFMDGRKPEAQEFLGLIGRTAAYHVGTRHRNFSCSIQNYTHLLPMCVCIHIRFNTTLKDEIKSLCAGNIDK